MMKTSLIQSFSIYGVVSIVTTGISFALFSLLTHYLTPTDYGMLALFNVYVSILIPIMGFSNSSFFQSEYFKVKDDKKKLQNLFSSNLILPILPFLSISLIFVLIGSVLERLIEIPRPYIYLIPVTAFLMTSWNLQSSYFVITKKTKGYSTLTITRAVLEAFLSILFIGVLVMNWEGRIYSWILTITIAALFSVYYSYKNNLLTLKINTKTLSAALAFGSPLIVHELGKLIINQSDRIFIHKMVSAESLGIYNSGYVIGSTISILSSVFIPVFTPFLFERLGNLNNEKAKEIIKLFYGFIAVLIISLIILVIITPILFEFLLNHSYSEGAQYVFWIGLAYVFWGMYLLFAGFLFYAKKTRDLGVLSVINITLNLSLNFILIRQFGTIGATYATAVSFFIVLLLVAYRARKLYRMPWLFFLKF